LQALCLSACARAQDDTAMLTCAIQLRLASGSESVYLGCLTKRPPPYRKADWRRWGGEVPYLFQRVLRYEGPSRLPK
jgi:hypothetical protein